jgi:Zn-finger nucleic acid-binding protein
MQCPLCKRHTLSPTELTPGLSSITCDECKGAWITRSNYEAWRARRPADTAETSTAAEFNVTDNHKAKLCPQCGRLLLPYRVGHGVSFSIDYCGACGGIWLDQNEWEAIKARNLHDNLHQIVTERWQTDVRQSAIQESIERAYERQLGGAYPKAQEIKAWLRGQPQKGLLLAYLADSQPAETGGARNPKETGGRAS